MDTMMVVGLLEYPETIPGATVDLLNDMIDDRVEAGDLVAASDRARADLKAEIRYYFTREAHARHVAVTPAAAAMLCDVDGREWDIFTMYLLAAQSIRRREPNWIALRFNFFGVTTTRRPHQCTLFAHRVIDQLVGEAVIFTTAEEVMGPEQGDAINRYGRLFAETGEDDEDADVE